MTLSHEYAVSVQIATPRTIAAVHAQVAIGSIPNVFGRYLDQVYAAAKTGAIKLDGQNVFLYRHIPDQPAQLHVAFGVGVTTPFVTTGNVEPTPLPVGEVATTTYWGNYAGLGAANRAITDWCRTHARRPAGPSWEVYGHWTDDESQLRTDVFYLLDPLTGTA